MGWYFAAGFVSGIGALVALYWFLDPDEGSELLTSEQKRIAEWTFRTD